MLENDANNLPSQDNEYDNSFAEYLHRAARACAAGDAVLGMHLYLAAFERAQHADGSAPDEAALDGLKQAWSLACALKERSLAEYVFERLEPYLSSEETAVCAEQLQKLALDKLEEFGLSREDLEDMTDMISQDFLGLESARLLRVEHVTSVPSPSAKTPDVVHADAILQDVSASPDGAFAGLGEAVVIDSPEQSSLEGTSGDSEASQPVVSTLESITYKELVGYDNAVTVMRDFGLGMQKDAQFQELVKQLNARHGLEGVPASDALLFRSPAREDASRFMVATLGELDLPAIRMRMEENLQGMPVLCVMAQADHQPSLNTARNAFTGAGVLILEDLDLWISPIVEAASDDFGGFLLASLSRGAREAISLIRSAAENPEVYVLASASEAGEIDSFFFDLLEPLSVIDIDFPTPAERDDIWMEIARDHPSLRGIDRELLVRFSTHMPRYDIYMAAREAVEEAYKASLVSRRYAAVTAGNLFDKLAAYQPLDSDEYQALEDAVVNDLRGELEHLEDLLKGKEE